MGDASGAPARGTVVFALLSAALTAALFVEIRENRALRTTLAKVTEMKARERGLVEGATLAPLELADAAGAPVRIEFQQAVGTVLLFHSGACDACAHTAPHWRSALLEAERPDLAVRVIQTDGAEARVDLEGLPASLVVPLPPVGWHANLPAVPATLLLDSAGVLVRAWYGELDEGERAELLAALRGLGT